jgi:hypothetical protein
MSTRASKQADRLFTEAVLGDGDDGYPRGASFVAADLPDWDEVVWRNLWAGKPTVVVNEDALEVMLVPAGRSGAANLLARVRGRVPVSVVWRSRSGERHYRLAARIDRKGLGELRASSATPI